MEMFMQHVNGTFERPSRLKDCLDIPVWLDTLVCQLMEKKPEQRPLNAAMVYTALEGIREKVEAQQSAGVDAAKRKFLDTPRDQRRVDDADKEAARTLLGGKGRLKKKRRQKRPFYRSVWMQALGLVALLAVTGLLLWIALKPPAPDKLYQQAKKLMDTNDPAQWDQALSGPIAQYQKHYSGRTDDQTKEVRQWAERVELSQNDRLVERYVESVRANKPLKVQSQNEAEEAAFKAAWAEEQGNLAAAEGQWQEMKTKYEIGSGFSRWGLLAEKRGEQVSRALKQDETWKQLLEDHGGAEPELKGLEQQAFAAYRAEPRRPAAGAARVGGVEGKLRKRAESETASARRRRALLASIRRNEAAQPESQGGRAEKVDVPRLALTARNGLAIPTERIARHPVTRSGNVQSGARTAARDDTRDLRLHGVGCRPRTTSGRTRASAAAAPAALGAGHHPARRHRRHTAHRGAGACPVRSAAAVEPATPAAPAASAPARWSRSASLRRLSERTAMVLRRGTAIRRTDRAEPFAEQRPAAGREHGGRRHTGE